MRELESKEVESVSGGGLVNINSVDFNLALSSAFFRPESIFLQPISNFTPWSPGGGTGNIGGISDEREES